MKWIKGRNGLPSLFKEVEWRNADGGDIPLGKATPLEIHKRCGACIERLEWLDESLLNSDMQMNGASQQHPNSKEKDDLIKELREQISTYKGRIERLHQSLEESEKQFGELQELYTKLLYE